MANLKFENVKDGVWYRINGTKLKVACCDCGLVHDYEFMTDGEDIYFRLFRNEKDTKIHRRHKN